MNRHIKYGGLISMELLLAGCMATTQCDCNKVSELVTEVRNHTPGANMLLQAEIDKCAKDKTQWNK